MEKLPHSRLYHLGLMVTRFAWWYLKPFDKLYAPLAAGILAPYPGDDRLTPEQNTKLDRLYRAEIAALEHLVDAEGLKAA